MSMRNIISYHEVHGTWDLEGMRDDARSSISGAKGCSNGGRNPQGDEKHGDEKHGSMVESCHELYHMSHKSCS